MTETKVAPKKTVTKKAVPAPAPAPAAETADVFAFPGFPAAEVPPALREFAETSMTKSKEAFAKFKEASEEAKTVLEETFEKTRAGVTELNAKAVDVAQTNTDATLAHVKDVMAVKTFADAIELQTAFMKKQMTVFQDQAKSFQDTTAKLTAETSAPYKAAFEKSLETFKVA